jgi:hypothetical protein
MIAPVLAAYTAGDAVKTLLVFFAWIAFIVVAISLLIGVVRDPNVQWWVKVLLILFIIIFPPLAVIGGLAFWLDRRSQSGEYRRVWEGPTTPLGVVVGPAEVHRLDGSTVIVEAGQQRQF